VFAVRCVCVALHVSSSISIMRTFLKPKLLPAWTRAILDTRVVAQLVKKFCAFYGTPKDYCRAHNSLLLDPCSQPDQSSPHPRPFISLASVLLLSHNICLIQLCCLLSSGFPPKYVHLLSQPCFSLPIPFHFDFVPLLVPCPVNSTNYDTR